MLASGLDGWLTRTDSSGTKAMLSDQLGSTLGLVNSGGSLATQFTYEPFGRTTFSGSSTANLYRFAGRELDLTGLYFMRARYYNPILQRFISPDPSGFGGGDPNLYVYVGNSPTNSVDPLGLGSGGWGCPGCNTAQLLKKLASSGQDPFLSSVSGGPASQTANAWQDVEGVPIVPGMSPAMTAEDAMDASPWLGSSVGFPGLTSIGGFSVSPGVAPSGAMSGTAGLVPGRLVLAQAAGQAPFRFAPAPCAESHKAALRALILPALRRYFRRIFCSRGGGVCDLHFCVLRWGVPACFLAGGTCLFEASGALGCRSQAKGGQFPNLGEPPG
jgi:RHS repeat-associated protein